MKRFITLTLFLLLFSACSNSPQTSNMGGQHSTNKATPLAKTKQISPKKQRIPKGDDLPQWIFNPNKPNQICEIGSSITQPTPKMTKKVALLMAKANISKQIKMYISNQSNSYKDNSGKSKFSTKSNQQSTSMLNDIVVADRHFSKEENRLYLRVCTPMK